MTLLLESSCFSAVGLVRGTIFPSFDIVYGAAGGKGAILAMTKKFGHSVAVAPEAFRAAAAEFFSFGGRFIL
jgi:hypothetical protein